MIKKISAVIIFFLCCSCSDNVAPVIKNLEKHLGIEITWEYKILNFEDEPGIGGSLKIIDLLFSEEDYKSLLDSLDLNNFSKFNTDYYKNIEIKDRRIRILLVTEECLIKYSDIE